MVAKWNRCGGSDMPTLTVKNIPDDLYAQLKRLAEMNRRSLNSEIIVCIERAVRGNRIQPAASLVRARELREKTARYPITDDEFNEAKMMGRL
jgi:hypothetical protein